MTTVRQAITVTEARDVRITVQGERSGKPQRFEFAAFKRRKLAQHGG